MDLDLSGHVQFGGVELQETVQSTEDQDGNDDGKITDEATELECIQGRAEERTLMYRDGGRGEAGSNPFTSN